MDGAVAEGTVSYFDQRRQETVQIAVGRHLRLVRPGTYCVVGLRIAHIDLLITENPNAGGGPSNPDGPGVGAGAADPRAGSERAAQVRHGGADDLELTHYPCRLRGSSTDSGGYGPHSRYALPLLVAGDQ